VIVKPSDIVPKDRYKLLIASVLPRPIAWVSSMDPAGNLNLAPFSYFTVGARSPMTLIFCTQVAGSAGAKKDTLRNIKSVPEFVVNITNEETAEKMNSTATVLPRGMSEFEWAGLNPEPSVTIDVPRIAEAPIAFECRLQQIVTISDGPGGGTAVFGEVDCIHIRDDIYDSGNIDLQGLKPIDRLAGSGYTRVTDIFEMERRPPPQI
jgi:flavin reductase (DIM6/NTAB) family NADH-FMN oxidoreductase RutF